MFPIELWLVIVNEIDKGDALLALAQTSRSLHAISLHALFTMLGFDWRSRDVHLNKHAPHENCLILRGLCCWLDVLGQSVDEVVYDCGDRSSYYTAFAYELRLLSLYFSKLSTVGRVTLRLYSPHSFDNTEPQVIHRATIDLLKDVAVKCRNIHVATTQLTDSGSVATLLSHMAQSDSTQVTQPCLERYTIETFPSFLRPFFLSTLQSNAATLTSLDFKDTSKEPDFSILLSSLRLPSLKHFCLKYAIILRLPLVNFLNNHPHIESIEFHHIQYRTASTADNGENDFLAQADPRSQALCKSLLQLHTSPEQLVNFFPPHLPKLREVTLAVASHRYQDLFKGLDEALGVLSIHTQLTQLHLRVIKPASGFSIWFSNMQLTDFSTRPEAKMSTVETLILDNGNFDISDTVYLQLIRWVWMFRGLKKLIIKCEPWIPTKVRHRATEGDIPLSGTLASRLKAARPSLREVTILTRFGWSHVYN